MAEGSPVVGAAVNSQATASARAVGKADENAQDQLAINIAAAQSALEGREYDRVAEILRNVDVDGGATMKQLIDCAELLAKSARVEQSDALYEALVSKFAGNRQVHFLYGKRLYVRGALTKAIKIFDGAMPFVEGTPPYQFIARAKKLLSVLEARECRRLGDDDDCRLWAMKHAILNFAKRKLRQIDPGGVGRLTLVTGGLGPGGAERQLSRTAAHLERARNTDGHIDGTQLRGKIEVLVRTHSGGGQRDFYLSDLQSADVSVVEIDKLPTIPPAEWGTADDDLAILLDYLPSKVEFASRRLVPHFRSSQPDVVSLWQDGACLFAGLAALVAGVPKVQLVIRGLPPVIRRHMFNPHYEEMYRSLAQVPGVEFVSNSKAAAVAYASWLDIPEERFSILYNGVQKMADTPSQELDAKWEAFCERTPEATHTIGGVFRFDIDKRPATWIQYAVRHFERYPDSRFILVGDGKLFDEAVALARKGGLSEHILFVGHSAHVGYWMSKMDVLVLMSSFEGLPNVLIEAQFLGVPVVSTPAGGAAECFVEGISGHILSCANQTDLDEAADKVHSLLGKARNPEVFGPIDRDFLEPNFSVTRMIGNFAHLAARSPSLNVE